MKSIHFFVILLVSSAAFAEIPGTGPYVEKHRFTAAESKEIVKSIVKLDPRASRSKTDLWSTIHFSCFRNTAQCFFETRGGPYTGPKRPNRLPERNTTLALRNAAKRLFGVNKYWNSIRAFGFENFQCQYESGQYRCEADVAHTDVRGERGLTLIQVGFTSYGYQTRMMKLMKKAGILCNIASTNIKYNVKDGDKTYVCPVPVQKLGYIDNWMQIECSTKKDYKKASALVRKSYFSGSFPIPIDSTKKPIAQIRFNSCVSYHDYSGIVPTSL